jgi:tetratricopeptide (TPR) repeat protein
MRPVALVLAFLLVSAADLHVLAQRSSAPPIVVSAAARIARVEAWLKAVDRHEPGTADEAATEVGSWPSDDLQSLWIDANVLGQLMRSPKLSGFTISVPGQRSQTLRYSLPELRRLNMLACVASGRLLSDTECRRYAAGSAVDGDLRRIAERVRMAALRGDAHDIMKRGAMLHGDIAMLQPLIEEPVGRPVVAAPRRLRLRFADGRDIDLRETGVHWELARMLLDDVMAARADSRQSPDPMVRQWYRATAAWMQAYQDYDPIHLEHARQILPSNADILFLSGTFHETLASSVVQTAIRHADIPFGVNFGVESAGWELRKAEGFFRRALEIEPALVEARIRHGRVLGQLDRHQEAVRALRPAIAAADDPLLLFYAQLFLGAALDALADRDGARAAYERAAELFPSAQSPHVALSALARRAGNRTSALAEIRQVFEAGEQGPDDPWWTYHVAQGRNVDELLGELQRMFAPDEGSRD